MSSTLPEAFVVDTDVISFSFKKDTRASFYHQYLVDQQVILSFMTVAELNSWALIHGWGATRRDQLGSYLRSFTLCESDPQLCDWWAVVRSEVRSLGRPIGVADAWIAATALLFDVPLVTHNPRDYSGVPSLDIRTASRP